ncbi:MAG: hypothetical protein N838_27135 [Thiohalocapsa sp. PB-PSB1]|mgnify:CR=1 FL=1|nr:MAG: hypothetical protein N838_27135 [Thiohalocapsa sp. PB-PSB1]
MAPSECVRCRYANQREGLGNRIARESVSTQIAMARFGMSTRSARMWLEVALAIGLPKPVAKVPI